MGYFNYYRIGDWFNLNVGRKRYEENINKLIKSRKEKLEKKINLNRKYENIKNEF